MSIELLAPAGDMERLRMAVAYGADAVYLAGSDFGMRAFAGNFDRKGLREAVELYHSDQKAWKKLQRADMTADFSWDVSAGQYLALYGRLLE